MNNDSDLNFHSMSKLSGWLRYGFTFRYDTVEVESGFNNRADWVFVVHVCKFPIINFFNKLFKLVPRAFLGAEFGTA